MLETSQAPAIYFPPADVRMELLQARRAGRPSASGRAAPSTSTSRRGAACAAAAAWAYPTPDPRYEPIRDHLAFYPQRVDLCLLGDERVEPNEGDFYGGWITSDIQGPFKGGPGSRGW